MSRGSTAAVVEDQALVRRIRSGSVEAWHAFIDAYTPLFFGVIRRYLPGAQDDQRRSIYVQMLEGLYTGKLAEYRGESRLSTWLFLFARSRCLDWLRSQNGRKGLPPRLRDLPEIDREVYRMYYVRGCSVHEICATLSARSGGFGIPELAACLEHIDQRLDARSRRRIAFDLQARSVGYSSGRLLDYIQHLRLEQERLAETATPEQELLNREAQQTLDLVQEFVERLPDLEKKVIDLRFYKGLTARRIAEYLQLPGERHVYTVEQRAIRRLRRMFEI